MHIIQTFWKKMSAFLFQLKVQKTVGRKKLEALKKAPAQGLKSTNKYFK